MAVVAVSQQVRILDVAVRSFGPSGGEIIREISARQVGAPFESLSYQQLDQMFAIVERDAPLLVGGMLTAGLMRTIDRLRRSMNSELSPSLVNVVARYLGPSAGVFLSNLRQRAGSVEEPVAATNLPLLADLAEQAAVEFLGPAGTLELGAAIRRLGTADLAERPPALHTLVDGLIDGDEAAAIRAICRQRLEADLEQLDLTSIPILVRAVEQDGGRTLGARRAASFVEASRRALSEPGAEMRLQLVALTGRLIGPAAPVVLKHVCTRQLIPFDALTYEHLGGLAEAMRATTRPLIGDARADELGRRIAGLLAAPF